MVSEELLESGGGSLFQGVDALDQARDVGGHDEEVAGGTGAGIPVGVGVPRGTSTADPAGACTSLSPTCTHRVPSRTYQASSSEWWRWRGAIRRGGPGGPPASRHSAITKESFGEPKIFPARGRARVCKLMAVDLVVVQSPLTRLTSTSCCRCA